MNLQILEKIGEGSYGIVYKGIYNGGACAIKEINHELYTNRNTYWNNECIILDNLSIESKKYTVRKLFAYSMDKRFYIVFEHINGPCSDYVIRHNSVKTRNKFEYANDLIRGLGYIHSSNIYHLDIKDSNIMYDYVYFRYIDFGVSVLKSQIEYDDIYHGAPYTHPPNTDKKEKISSEIMKACDYWSLGIALLRWYGMEYNKNFYTTLAYAFGQDDIENIKEDPKYPIYSELSRDFLEYLIELIENVKIREIIGLLLTVNPYERCEKFIKIFELLRN